MRYHIIDIKSGEILGYAINLRGAQKAVKIENGRTSYPCAFYREA